MRFRNWVESIEKKIISVSLYPCHGLKGHTKDRHRWIVTERYDDGTRNENAGEFNSVDEAKNHYAKILGELRVSEYRDKPKTGDIDDWFGKGEYIGDPNPNFFVTGSHGMCSICVEINRRVNPIDPAIEDAMKKRLAELKRKST